MTKKWLKVALKISSGRRGGQKQHLTIESQAKPQGKPDDAPAPAPAPAAAAAAAAEEAPAPAPAAAAPAPAPAASAAAAPAASPAAAEQPKEDARLRENFKRVT